MEQPLGQAPRAWPLRAFAEPPKLLRDEVRSIAGDPAQLATILSGWGVLFYGVSDKKKEKAFLELSHSGERVLMTAYKASDFGLDPESSVNKDREPRKLRSLKIFVAKSDSMREGKIVAYPDSIPDGQKRGTFYTWNGPGRGFETSFAHAIRRPEAGAVTASRARSKGIDSESFVGIDSQTDQPTDNHIDNSAAAAAAPVSPSDRTLARQAKRRRIAKAEPEYHQTMPPSSPGDIDTAVTTTSVSSRQHTHRSATSARRATSSITIARPPHIQALLTPPSTPTPANGSATTSEMKLSPKVMKEEEELEIIDVREVRKRKAAELITRHDPQKLGVVVKFIDEVGNQKRVRPWAQCRSLEDLFRHAVTASIVLSTKGNDPLAINVVGSNAGELRVMKDDEGDRKDFEQLVTLIEDMGTGVVEVRAC